MSEVQLKPIKLVRVDRHYHKYYLYECKCGNTTIARKNNVNGGSVKSCGCLLKRRRVPLYNSKIYHTYANIVQRCTNVKNPRYVNYGGRGIKNKWKSYKHFYDDMYESFLEHSKKYGGRNTSLDRIDNDGDYCKENCRWATLQEQFRTRRGRKSAKFYMTAK